MAPRVVITGVYSYMGAAVAGHLLREGHTVHTLTNRRAPAQGTPISFAPLRFDLDHLTRELKGASVLVNTYWIRLPYKDQTFDTAIANSCLLN